MLGADRYYYFFVSYINKEIRLSQIYAAYNMGDLVFRGLKGDTNTFTNPNTYYQHNFITLDKMGDLLIRAGNAMKEGRLHFLEANYAVMFFTIEECTTNKQRTERFKQMKHIAKLQMQEILNV